MPAGDFLNQKTLPGQNLDQVWDGFQAAGQAEEDRLVLSAQAGNLAAFNRLVIAHQDCLYGWIVSLVKDEALADDLTQSTFITAFEKLNSFRGGSFRGWLFTIARNRSLDEIRRNKRHPSISLDGFSNDADQAQGDRYETMHAMTGDVLHPEDAVIRSEQAEQIHRLVAALPDPFRQVLELVDVHELDYPEVAQILHLPLGTVKSRLARARLRLRALFLQNGLISQPAGTE